MSGQDQPPPYQDHSKYQTEPPQEVQQQFYQQNFQPHPQGFQQPPLLSVPPVGNYQTAPQVAVVTHQPTSVHVRTYPVMGPIPVTMTCSNCYAYITTATSHEISLRTHCCALCLCFVGLWPCVICPYICGGVCQRTVHKCPNCNNFIGTD